VARRTRETLLLCEAAGYDVVIVETVGVGQSETAVAQMVDVFVLLLLPGAGDELQGIKRGIVEVADILVVNKADGDQKGAANHAAAEYRHALALLRGSGGWTPPVLQCSALENRGIDAVWDMIGRFRQDMGDALAERRAEQARSWLWRELGDGLIDALRGHPAVAKALPALEAEVAAGCLLPTAAARRLLERFLRG
jgi:LAO/AO transport system kinase